MPGTPSSMAVAAALGSALLTTVGATAGPAAAPPPYERDRAVVAVAGKSGVYLGWRMVRSEANGANASGLTGPAYRVLRDGKVIATVRDSSNYLDPDGTAANRYAIAVGDSVTQPVAPWTTPYRAIPLDKPADATTPKGDRYGYTANDASIGDLDGDGELEVVLKWDPDNSRDVSQKGYTGLVYLDAYKLDGRRLWRLDLGPNIRAGAHYTQFLVQDFDGDGKAEVMLKTAPGSRDGKGKFVTLPQEDVAAGVRDSDDYRLSVAGYRAHLAKMFVDWADYPEVREGRWPATIYAALGRAPEGNGKPTPAEAEALADWFIAKFAPAKSQRNDLTTFEGFIVHGPEYLTVFEGATGAELQTVRYVPDRADDGLRWGDYALARIEPANRVDRFLATPAYLDGPSKPPSAIFARGYYTRSTLAAWNWNGKALALRWFTDSGWVPMANPFNASPNPHLMPGSDPNLGRLAGQGDHSLSAADVDGDGRQEIVYGGATVDDDGSLLYSSFAALPEGSAAPGAERPFGHGDAIHVADIDPAIDGLEIFTAHENGTNAPYGYALRRARDGAPIWGRYTGKDTGRAMIGDIDPARPGLEVWASRPLADKEADASLRDVKGGAIAGELPGTNMSVLWSGDLTRQIITGAGDETPAIVDWKKGVLLSLDGTRANNGTKGNPALVADIIGDWREEVLMRSSDSTELRLYTTTEVTKHRLYTLLADPQYRIEVARQQTTYNQPSYPSFYLATDMDFAKVPRDPR